MTEVLSYALQTQGSKNIASATTGLRQGCGTGLSACPAQAGALIGSLDGLAAAKVGELEPAVEELELDLHMLAVTQFVAHRLGPQRILVHFHRQV